MDRWSLFLSFILSLTVSAISADYFAPILTDGIEKRFRVWPTIREKKELDETTEDLREARERLTNGQMLKQPLLRFDLLWRRFSGKRRQDDNNSY